MFAGPSYQSWPRVAFVQHTRRSWPLRGLSMAADAGREAPRARLGLAGRNRGDAQMEFIQSRLVPVEGPLLDGRAPVVARGGLRQPCKFVRKPQRFAKRSTRFDE